MDFPLSDRLKDKPKIRIKFFNGTIPYSGCIHLNPAYWALKTYYKNRGQHFDRIVWLEAIHYNMCITESSLLGMLADEQPDVICFGLYLWNHDLYSKFGRLIKQHYPNIILLGGGPEVYAHKEPQMFWSKNDWLDAASYGDGEMAFVSMLDAMIDSSSADGQPTNLSYKTGSEIITHPFKRFKDQEINTISYFLDNKQDVEASVDQVRKSDPSLRIIMNWEFTKGCPYRCSFCDWSSGLHHKVTRKAYDWRSDLDYLASLGIHVRWCDANPGQFKDDIDIVKYAYDLEDTNANFNFSYNNLAKLNKKAVFEIIEYTEHKRPGVKKHNLSVQDIHKDVLENIDRPDVPWPEHKDMILKTKQQYPSMNFNMEMMIGLPGQTLESCAEMILEFSDIGANEILGHIWCMLINSPGYNKEYKDQHKLEVKPALHITTLFSGINARHEIEGNLHCCEYWLADTVVGTATADLPDILSIYGMINLYNWMMKNKIRKIDRQVFTRVISNHSYWRRFGETMAKPMREDLDRYGRMYLTAETEGKPVTFSQYYNDQRTMADIIKAAY